MNKLTENFNNIFKGMANQTNWSRGYDDCMANKPPRESCEHYNQGYGVAYEFKEKQIART